MGDPTIPLTSVCLTCQPHGTCHLPGNQKPDLMAHPVKNPLTCHPLGTCHHPGNQKPDLTAHPLKPDLMVHPVHPGNQKPDLMVHLEKNPLTCHPLGTCHHPGICHLPGNHKPDPLKKRVFGNLI